MVFNKIDAYAYVKKDEDDLTPKSMENYTLDELKRSWMARNNILSLFISAKNKINMDEFRELLYTKVKEIHVERYPYNNFLY
jgi:GTP-binding protein HflX